MIGTRALHVDNVAGETLRVTVAYSQRNYPVISGLISGEELVGTDGCPIRRLQVGMNPDLPAVAETVVWSLLRPATQHLHPG